MSEPRQDDWFDFMKAITYAHVERISKVADQGKASSVRIGSLCVGSGGGESVSSPLYLLSAEIVSLVEADRLLKSLSVTGDYAVIL